MAPAGFDWSLRASGTFLGFFSTLQAAMDAAKGEAISYRPSEVVVVRRDGSRSTWKYQGDT